MANQQGSSKLTCVGVGSGTTAGAGRSGGGREEPEESGLSSGTGFGVLAAGLPAAIGMSFRIQEIPISQFHFLDFSTPTSQFQAGIQSGCSDCTGRQYDEDWV